MQEEKYSRDDKNYNSEDGEGEYECRYSSTIEHNECDEYERERSTNFSPSDIWLGWVLFCYKNPNKRNKRGKDTNLFFFCIGSCDMLIGDIECECMYRTSIYTMICSICTMDKESAEYWHHTSKDNRVEWYPKKLEVHKWLEEREIENNAHNTDAHDGTCTSSMSSDIGFTEGCICSNKEKKRSKKKVCYHRIDAGLLIHRNWEDRGILTNTW